MPGQEKVHPEPFAGQLQQQQQQAPLPPSYSEVIASESAVSAQPGSSKPQTSASQPIDQTIAVPSTSAQYRHQPVKVICHACQAEVVTSVSPKMGVAVCGSIFAFIIFGCYLGCCLIPLCVRDMYDTVHRCPSCKVQVGIYQVIKF